MQLAVSKSDVIHNTRQKCKQILSEKETIPRPLWVVNHLFSWCVSVFSIDGPPAPGVQQHQQRVNLQEEANVSNLVTLLVLAYLPFMQKVNSENSVQASHQGKNTKLL
jgi:hypothetical protein